MCYIESDDAVHGTICSQYMDHAWYSDLFSRSIKLIFELGSSLSMRYLAFAISSDNVNWEILHVCDSQNNAVASVTIPDTYDGTVKFGVKLYDTPPTVGSVLNVGFDYVITGGIDLSSSQSNVKKVAMSCATEGAEIKYTLDGTDPTEASTGYVEEIEVEIPVTIKARGYKDGLLDGDVATLVFDAPIVDTPVITQDGNNVTITCATEGASIYYTLDGNTPTSGSTLYSGTFAISASCTVKAIAVNDGWIDSEVASYSATYTPPVLQTPTLSLSRSGSTVSGTIGNTVSGATYRYKVGSAPTSESDGTAISGTSFSFTNSSAITVYVRGFMTGYTMSNAVSASVSAYTPTCATPSISFASSTNRVTITCATSGATIYYRRGTSGSYSVYSGSFTITSTTTIYAYATKSGYNNSSTTSRTCTYTRPAMPTPIVSIDPNPDDDVTYYYPIIKVTNASSFPSGTTFGGIYKVKATFTIYEYTLSSNTTGYWALGKKTERGYQATVTASCSGYSSTTGTGSVNWS